MSNTAVNAVAARPDVGAAAQQYLADSMTWLSANWLQIAIAAGVGTGIVLTLLFLRRLGVKLRDRPSLMNGWGGIIGRAVSRTNLFFIIMLAARIVDGYTSPPETVATTINFLWTLAAVFQAAIWARELILGGIEHRTASERYHGEALANAMGIIRLLVTVVLFAIALIVVLDNLGVNVTGLVAGLGVGGIAIGLAAQGIFSDLFAALAILFDKPFRRGDAISYDGTSGTVEAIGLKSTRIRALSGEERIISNKKLLDKEISNNTKRDRRRHKLVLGVTYETDMAKLRAIPDTMKAIVEDKGGDFVRCGFVTFNDSSVDFELEFESPSQDFGQFYALRHDIGLAILDRFNSDGIGLAYPTQVGYVAAPDGTIVAPYCDALPTHEVTSQTKEDR